MTAHIIQHSEQQSWPMMASWVSATAPPLCGSSTWSKRVATDSDSWEVRAFAEDASSSGLWPPRSYSCSFCQREFRTAQALGGHMNVHRRERAHVNQLASLRTAAARLSTTATSPGSQSGTTVELLSSKAQLSVPMSGSMVAHNSLTTPPSSSLPSQESNSSTSTATMMQSEVGTKPLLQSIPDILSETLSWAPSRGGTTYHPYEKSFSRCKPGPQGARFSFCLSKVMGEHEDTLDLELRLGRSSCAV